MNKKPFIWIVLAVIVIGVLAIVVSVFDKEKEDTETVVVPEQAIEIEVEVEEIPAEIKKTDGEIIRERFMNLDWAEVHASAKNFGEDGWEEGIVLLGAIPSADIRMFGYNDEEYHYRGVAIEHDGNVNYFDWIYTSDLHIQPEMYWKDEERQLQVTLNLYEGEGINAEELHVLVEYETGTMEDFAYRSKIYLEVIESRLEGTGLEIGSYVNIKLGEAVFLQFEPTKVVEDELITLKLHQAVIHLNPTKDGFRFELDDIGVEPEKREAEIKIEGEEEAFTEVEYISKNGFSIWYPEYILEPYKIFGHDGFVIPGQGDDSQVKVTIVPEGGMELDESYLEEAAGNYKDSGEYKKVKISEIKTLKSENKDVQIKMIQVVHDDTADRFYIIQNEKKALLITVSMTKESLEGMGSRINKMIQTIAFTK